MRRKKCAISYYGALLSLIKGKYVYVPVDDVLGKYEEYFNQYGGSPGLFEEVIRRNISREYLQEFWSALTEVNNEIERLINNGRDNVLFALLKSLEIDRIDMQHTEDQCSIWSLLISHHFG